ALVAVTVAGDFMAGCVDVADQRGKPFGDPAEHEKGRADVLPPEHVEYAPRIGLDPGGPARPVLAPDASLEGRHLEIVLDIHRHGVDDGPGPGRHRVHSSFRPDGMGWSFPYASLSGRGSWCVVDASMPLSRISSRISRSSILLYFSSSPSVASSSLDAGGASPRSGVDGGASWSGSRVCGTSGISSRISWSTTDS